jgi:hypothetical protein
MKLRKQLQQQQRVQAAEKQSENDNEVWTTSASHCTRRRVIEMLVS